MKTIEIEEDLYQYIASNTQFIGESATSILRRLLLDKSAEVHVVLESNVNANVEQSSEEANVVNTNEAEVEIGTTVPDFDIEPLEGNDESESVEAAESNESVFNYINKEELAMQRGAVGRFLLILGALYRVHSRQFSVVSDIRGRDRLYFSAHLNELTESGSSTKPFQIPDSPYWVVTNSNTTRKKMILTKVAIALGYNESEAENIRELL
jgi:negative modulator of initiation of replication